MIHAWSNQTSLPICHAREKCHANLRQSCGAYTHLASSSRSATPSAASRGSSQPSNSPSLLAVAGGSRWRCGARACTSTGSRDSGLWVATTTMTGRACRGFACVEVAELLTGRAGLMGCNDKCRREFLCIVTRRIMFIVNCHGLQHARRHQLAQHKNKKQPGTLVFEQPILQLTCCMSVCGEPCQASKQAITSWRKCCLLSNATLCSLSLQLPVPMLSLLKVPPDLLISAYDASSAAAARYHACIRLVAAMSCTLCMAQKLARTIS